MNKEAIKLDLIKVFTETKFIEPPVIDDDFADRFMNMFIHNMIEACRNAIQVGIAEIYISQWFVSSYDLDYPSQYTDKMYGKMIPNIIDVLEELGIPYVFGEEAPSPSIRIKLNDIRKFANVDNLGALK